MVKEKSVKISPKQKATKKKNNNNNHIIEM